MINKLNTADKYNQAKKSHSTPIDTEKAFDKIHSSL
jgi:hypothetical protein